MHRACPHVPDLSAVPAPLDVCEVCVEEGSTWVHLRQCLTCHRTLCCNDSPKQHMSRHAEATGHPAMRTVEPGEDWVWCFADDAMVRPFGDGWETYSPFLAMGIEAFAEHLADGGSPHPGIAVRNSWGFPLGEWLGYVRKLRAAGELDPRDAAEIEAIPGWTW